jgi:hypothetical protein
MFGRHVTREVRKAPLAARTDAITDALQFLFRLLPRLLFGFKKLLVAERFAFGRCEFARLLFKLFLEARVLVVIGITPPTFTVGARPVAAISSTVRPVSLIDCVDATAGAAVDCVECHQCRE